MPVCGRCWAEPPLPMMPQDRVSQSTDDIEVDLEGSPNDLAGKWHEEPECGLAAYSVPDDE